RDRAILSAGAQAQRHAQQRCVPGCTSRGMGADVHGGVLPVSGGHVYQSIDHFKRRQTRPPPPTILVGTWSPQMANSGTFSGKPMWGRDTEVQVLVFCSK